MTSMPNFKPLLMIRGYQAEAYADLHRQKTVKNSYRPNVKPL